MAGDARLAILAEGTLDFHHGKTAVSLLRYRPSDVVAVIDRSHAGRTTGEVLGLGGEIPVVADVAAALTMNPTALLIGIAPAGGALPESWRSEILRAISAGLDVISGLHVLLSDDAEFAAAAHEAGVNLVDVRRAPPGRHVTEMLARRPGSRVITFVGSDCAVGKMTAALEIEADARTRGLSTAFVATGQTGIMLAGSGIPLDHVIGDFMAGEIEQLVVEACGRADWVFVEGQGSLLHPAYSGVTLALMHGSQPDAMILVYLPNRDTIEEFPVPIPPLTQLVRIYEEAAGWVKPARVVGIALNTRELDDEAAREAITDAREQTGLPATDPVRYGAGVLVDAVLRATPEIQRERR